VWHLEAPEWADQVPSGDASTGDDTDDDDSPFN